MPSDRAALTAAAGPRPSRVAARTVADLLALLPGARLSGGSPQSTLTGVTLNSRAVAQGDLYAALAGARAHGASFTAQALDAGAVAVLTDEAGAALIGNSPDVPVVVVDDPRSSIGEVAAWIYGRPAERLTTFGVTGTNGKTTTTFLLAGALEWLGHRCGLIGTVENRVGARRLPSVRTTPEAPDLQALLAVMVEEGADTCALEVSSHALRLHRVDAVRVDVAGFTNLSQDHLDFHPDMEDYFAAKAELFTAARAAAAVVCVDDAWGERMARLARAHGLPTTTFATGSAAAGRRSAERPDVVVEVDGDEDAWAPIRLRGVSGDVLCRLVPPLPGSFNRANAALAVLMLAARGVQPSAAAEAVAAAGAVPGRMERVLPPGLDPADPRLPLAVVDYAHTPAAVEAAVHALAGRRPLVVVLGAGGDRDHGKRPLMGAAAAAADVVVVTDDNPRSEDPAQIRAAVLDGARAAGGARVLDVPDRGTAIRAAVDLAMGGPAGGTVLVAGKGHERGQDYAGVVHPFDDRIAVAQALAAAAGLAPEES